MTQGVRLRAHCPALAACAGWGAAHRCGLQTWKFTTSELSIKPALGGPEFFPETVIREPVSMQCLDERLAVPEPD